MNLESRKSRILIICVCVAAIAVIFSHADTIRAKSAKLQKTTKVYQAEFLEKHKLVHDKLKVHPNDKIYTKYLKQYLRTLESQYSGYFETKKDEFIRLSKVVKKGGSYIYEPIHNQISNKNK